MLVAGLYTGDGVGDSDIDGFYGEKELFPMEKGPQTLPPALSSEGTRLRQNVVYKVLDDRGTRRESLA